MTSGTAAGSPLRRLAPAAVLAWRAHRTATAASAAIAATLGAAPVVVAWLTKLVLDELAHGGRTARLLPLAVALGAAGLVVVALPAVADYAEGQLRRSLQAAIQDRLFRAVNRHPGLSRFENPAFHDRIRLAREAGQNAPQQIVDSALASAQGLITLAGFVAALLAVSPLMTAIVAVSALPTVRVELRLSHRRAEMMWGISATTRRQFFFANLLVSPEAAKEIRLFGLGDFLRERMLGELRAVHWAERKLARRTLRGQGSLAALGALVAAGGLVWAVLGAAHGRLSIGDVSVFVAGVAGVQAALVALIGRSAQAHHALLMFGHYLTVTDAEPDLPVPAAPARLPALANGIELRNVWFRYDPDHPWVLRGVDLWIPYGRAVALVGLNGAGKSTLVKLLCRLYDPEHGTIRWDGVDLRDVHPDDLRARIGVLFQDFVAYDLTAAENIRLGDVDAGDDRDRIRAAAHRAGVHQRLDALPAGYDTMLSRVFADIEDPRAGVALSGGEWQRLALARTLMRDRRDLLILDEPSSGLDAQAEHSVHEGLRRHRAHRTSLLISHRLGAVRDADLIVVLAEGRVAERGTHGELMATGGAYARLFTLQARGYEQPAQAAGAPPAWPPVVGDSLRTATPSTRSTGT